MKKYITPSMDMLPMSSMNMIMASDSLDIYPDEGDKNNQGAPRHKDYAIDDNDDYGW